MNGWVIKRVAQGATHSLGYRAFLAGLGGHFIRCRIQWPPESSGIVSIDLPTPARGTARLRVPIDAVEFNHRQLAHSWPLRAYPAFIEAWRVARSAGASQHMFRIMLRRQALGSEGEE